MNSLYRTVGISKQGFHQWLDRWMAREEEMEQLLVIIDQIRRDHPVMGCRQLYKKIMPKTMGRDRFEKFCYSNGFKVPVRKSYIKTTNSQGIFRFPNLILEIEKLTGVNQLWVSDITYYDIEECFYYLTFITDIFNREIIGYNASKTLRTTDTTLPSMQMAIRRRQLKKGCRLIFHSDGGGQYYSKRFLKLTQAYGIRNSMAKSVYENPFAERINGTIKNDYLKPYRPINFDELLGLLAKAVKLYNEDRPHKSLGGLSPKAFGDATKEGIIEKTWTIKRRRKVISKAKTYININ